MAWEVSILVGDGIKSLVVVFKTYREPNNPSNPPANPTSDWEDTIIHKQEFTLVVLVCKDRAFEEVIQQRWRMFDMEATKLLLQINMVKYSMKVNTLEHQMF